MLCVCVVLQFQFVNSFLSLFYIAFYLQDMQLLKDVSYCCSVMSFVITFINKLNDCIKCRLCCDDSNTLLIAQ